MNIRHIFGVMICAACVLTFGKPITRCFVYVNYSRGPPKYSLYNMVLPRELLLHSFAVTAGHKSACRKSFSGLV